MLSESVIDTVVLALNVMSTIGIVIMNKLVLRSFPFAMTLTWCHQVTATFLMTVQGGCKCQPDKAFPWYVDVWWAFLNVSTFYSQNMSLKINTVTFHQTTKLLVIPTQCLYQYVTHGKVFTVYVYGALVVLTMGVGITTIAELNVTATVSGLTMALLGVITVVLEQAECYRIRDKYKLSSVEANHSNLKYRMALSSVLVFAVERQALYALSSISIAAWLTLSLSCLLALCVSITAVAVIGKFGVVTPIVIGHMKTMLIITLGFCIYPPPLDLAFAKNLTGITIAVFGAVKYGQYTTFPQADWFARCRSGKHKDLKECYHQEMCEIVGNRDEDN